MVAGSVTWLLIEMSKSLRKHPGNSLPSSQPSQPIQYYILALKQVVFCRRNTQRICMVSKTTKSAALREILPTHVCMYCISIYTKSKSTCRYIAKTIQEGLMFTLWRVYGVILRLLHCISEDCCHKCHVRILTSGFYLYIVAKQVIIHFMSIIGDNAKLC